MNANKEYSEKVLYSHGERCRYKGKTYQASCYKAHLQNINPEDGVDVFWLEIS